MSTICAVSTPAGRGGIAVVRISGPQAIEIAEKRWQGKPLSQAESHTVRLGGVLDSQGNLLDQAVATVYRSPRSFTGEDVVEFSTHGSVYVQRALLESLVGAGARIAEPGEFTRRSFVNGKLDLAEAEAVADIISSSSRAAHSLAVNQLQGRFSAHINDLREKLINLAALLELELDFSEEDVTFADRSQLKQLSAEIIDFISRMAATFASGNAIREGVAVAIVGRPNAGKSSLLNALTESDRAIVSDIPGTTRDTIEDTIDIQGVTFRFIDTAGIRHTDDPIESLGIERAFSSLSKARIVLWLLDPEITAEEISDGEERIACRISPDAKLLKIASKSDLSKETAAICDFKISALTHEGLPELKSRLYELAQADMPADESMVVTNARHHAALVSARRSLMELVEGIDILTPDLLAQHLRSAIASLSDITGQITSSTVLQTIFSRFCIGK